jgi:hypothetical protein
MPTIRAQTAISVRMQATITGFGPSALSALPPSHVATAEVRAPTMPKIPTCVIDQSRTSTA